MTRWPAELPGVVELPSGRRILGCSRRRLPAIPPADLTVLLAATRPKVLSKQVAWIRWRDFCSPGDRRRASTVLATAWQRSRQDCVVVSCRGGTGRTGTALACIAVLDGLDPAEAIALIRKRYDPHAIETPWQKRYVTTFTTASE